MRFHYDPYTERAGGEGTLRRAALPPGLLGELPRGPCWAPFNTRQLGLVQMSGRHCLDCILITILHSLPNAKPSVHNKCSGHLIITWNALPCISFSIFCLPMRLQGFCTQGPGSCTLHPGDSLPQRHMPEQGWVQRPETAGDDRGGGHGSDIRPLLGMGKGLRSKTWLEVKEQVLSGMWSPARD